MPTIQPFTKMKWPLKIKEVREHDGNRTQQETIIDCQTAKGCNYKVALAACFVVIPNVLSLIETVT